MILVLTTKKHRLFYIFVKERLVRKEENKKQEQLKSHVSS